MKLKKIINKHTKQIFVICVVLLVLTVYTTLEDRREYPSKSELLSKEQAINYLKTEIAKLDKKHYWLGIDNCVSYVVDDRVAQWVVELHEKHGGQCAGDPNTSPLIAQFKVDKQTKAIVWHDVLNDKYVSYAELAANQCTPISKDLAIEKVIEQSEVKDYLRQNPSTPTGQTSTAKVSVDEETALVYKVHVYSQEQYEDDREMNHATTFNWYAVDKCTGEINCSFTQYDAEGNILRVSNGNDYPCD